MMKEYKGFKFILKEALHGPDFICGPYNGYVVIPSMHEIFKKDYDELTNIDCHGGLTFSNYIEEDKWAIGFDTCHLGDNKENCDKRFVIRECKNIIDQLIKIYNVNEYKWI